MKQEMIKLNRIRIAYSEEDRKRLAADGYEPVGAADTAAAGQIPAETEKSTEDSIPEKAKNGRKTAGKVKAAGGEEKDA